MLWGGIYIFIIGPTWFQDWHVYNLLVLDTNRTGQASIAGVLIFINKGQFTILQILEGQNVANVSGNFPGINGRKLHHIWYYEEE